MTGKKATPEEMAVYIGKRLLNLKNAEGIITWQPTYSPHPYYAGAYIHVFTQWLSSPEGLNAVERAMISRDYYFCLFTDLNDLAIEYYACFHKALHQKENGYRNDTKAEAILTAAYMALKAEDNAH